MGILLLTSGGRSDALGAQLTGMVAKRILLV